MKNNQKEFKKLKETCEQFHWFTFPPVGFEATLRTEDGSCYRGRLENISEILDQAKESGRKEMLEAYKTMKYHEDKHGETSAKMYENWKKGEEFPCYEYNEWLLAYAQFEPEIFKHL